MQNENLSERNGTNGEELASGSAEANNRCAELSMKVSVLAQNPYPHGLLKTWLEGSSSLRLHYWRAATLAGAREIAASPSDVALVEAHCSGDQGIQCAYLLKRLQPRITVLMFTDVADLATCMRCYQAGADGYVTTLSTRQFFEGTIMEALRGWKPFPREIGKIIAEHWTMRFVLPNKGLLTQIGRAHV